MTNSALITGSAKRIGREIAIDLAKKGFNIAISYNNSSDDAKKLKDIILQYGVKCEIFQADLLKKSEAKKLINQVINKFCDLNLLINNASIFNESNFFEDETELENNLNLHFFAPQILSKEFAKNIKKNDIKEAQIINICDKNIVRYDTKYFYYLLSKKLLAEFSKMLSLELAPDIRVNAIAPGFIIENKFMQENPEIIEKAAKKIPLNRKGEMKNIVQTVNYFLENDFVNGHIAYVDGAASLNHAG